MVNIDEGIKVIKKLISDNDWKRALYGCQELLKYNPFNSDLQSLMKKIEAHLIEENEKKVNTDISSTMHLWDEGRYSELMGIYMKLYKYAPNNTRLRDLIEKLKSKLTDTEQDKREGIIKKALEIIKKLINDKKYADAVQACNEFLDFDSTNLAVQQYMLDAKDGIIEQKLKENPNIMESADFDRQLEFFQSLEKINPKNEKVQNVLFQIKEHFGEQKMIAEKMHLNESIERMKALFKSAEYEKTVQACEEIDRIEHGNFTAGVFKKKALETIKVETDIEAVKKMKEDYPALEQEYKTKPQEFVII